MRSSLSTDPGNVRSLLRSLKLGKNGAEVGKFPISVPFLLVSKGYAFCLCLLSNFQGVGVNRDNSEFGFPGGRGDTKTAVIRGQVWIFF